MLGLLHTAASHAPAFEARLRAVDATIAVRHAVEPRLLADAAAAGRVDAALRARVVAAVDDLRAAGARLVVCTCTTIGDAAESADRPASPVLRVDRPMAEAAVARGARIGVVAALPTALEATLELLRRVAAEQGRDVAPRAVTCAEAWPSFERGDLDGYLTAVATAVRAAADDADAVVLAQASMAGVIERVGDLAVPVLASPELGIRTAVERYRALG